MKDRELRPELQVLLACARPAPDAARLAAALAGPLDWERLLALCTRHALLPVVERRLQGLEVPPGARERLGRAARTALAQSLMLAEELRRVLAELRARAIPALAYKGPALALQVHGDVALRSFRDLDVLVTRADFFRARDALFDLGYRAGDTISGAQEEALLRSECDQTLVHAGSGAIVELHWAVTPPHFSFPLTTEELLRHAVTVELSGLPVSAPAPEDLLLLLAMNGAKDLWTRLEPAALVAALLGRPLDWPRVAARARRLRAERMLALAVALARELLDAPAPPLDLDAPAALVGEARANLLDDAPNPTLWQIARFRLRAREHWADGLRYCALRALQPTAADAPPWPRRWWPVAFARRPFRLLRALARNRA
jgi:hypothetical protein